jgi:hypothetical protein
MNRIPKPRPCPVCREEFTPRRIPNTLKITPCCTNPGCVLDYAQGFRAKEPIKKKPKPKVKTAAALKKQLWPIFSLHQKLVYSEDGEWCQCYTCDKPLHIGTTNCQGGHCLPKGAFKNLYFDERAVRPQCYYCNINLGGQHYHFCEKLKLEIGLEAFEDMERHGKDVVKRDAQWYLDKIDYYTEQVASLKKIRSIY